MDSQRDQSAFERQLHSILDWNFPICFSPDHHQSPGTRLPHFMDAHLADDLILKHVIVYPSLCTELREIVDNVIERVPIPQVISPDLIQPYTDGAPRQERIVQERELELLYNELVAIRSCKIVSFLILETSAAGRLLKWTSAPLRSDKAIADGYLRIQEDEVERMLAQSPQILSDKVRSDVGALNGISELVVWEFKTSMAASPAVASEIERIAQGGAYSWYRCLGGLSRHCNPSKHNTDDGKVTETWFPRGPDAPSSPKVTTTSPIEPWDGLIPQGGQPYVPVKAKAKKSRPRDKAHYILQQVSIIHRNNYKLMASSPVRHGRKLLDGM